MSFQNGNRRGDRKRGSRNRADLLLREFATTILTDPKVQQRLLDQARAGKLHPSLMRELFHYYGGKPPDRVEAPKSTGDDDKRAARLEGLNRLSEEQRRQYTDILLCIQGPPA